MSAQTANAQSLHGFLRALLESVMYANHQSALQTFESMKAIGFSKAGESILGEAKYLEFESEVMDVHGPVRQLVKLPLLSMLSPKAIGIKDAELKFDFHVNLGEPSSTQVIPAPETIGGAFSNCIDLKISGERKEAGTIAIEMRINVSEIPVQGGLKQLMDDLSESHLRKKVRKQE